MSFFEDVFGSDGDAGDETPLKEPEAFAAIALALSAADGEVEDVELENIVTYLRRMHMFRDFETADRPAADGEANLLTQMPRGIDLFGPVYVTVERAPNPRAPTDPPTVSGQLDSLTVEAPAAAEFDHRVLVQHDRQLGQS